MLSTLEPYQQLELQFGQWMDQKNVVACSSGTGALHLALEALRLPYGSSIIVPDFSMIACARAVTLAGLEPVFADCGDDLLLDVDELDRLAKEGGGKVSAVLPVHIYGRRCDMGAINLLANKYDLFVIEDMAEAHGIKPHSSSDAACWSFFKNKIVYGEEGGAVAFADPEAAALARSLRCLGFTEQHDFNHIPRGHNYRLANTLAGLILSSLGQYQHNMIYRRELELLYDEMCPSKWRMPRRNAVWVYDLRIPGMTNGQQNNVVTALREAGIAARHSFKPLSFQEEYSRRRPVEEKPKRRTMWDTQEENRSKQNKNALRLSQEVIYLPVQPGVTTEESIEKSYKVIHQALEQE